MLRLSDYTLDLEGLDWRDLLASWVWILPRKFTVWFANRYGDLFLAFEDGSVHKLDVGVGSLSKLAESRDDFADVVDEGNNANDWLMIPLVDELVAAGMTPGRGECYSYVQLPILGGDYTVANPAWSRSLTTTRPSARFTTESKACRTDLG